LSRSPCLPCSDLISGDPSPPAVSVDLCAGKGNQPLRESYRSKITFLLGMMPKAIGVILLIAAGLKAHGLLTEPFSRFWFQVGLVEVELICGLALLLNVFPQATRWAGLALFSAFIVVSSFHLATGVHSCGCLGKVPLQPWMALAFDVAAVFGLWHWQPKENGCLSSVPTLGCLLPLGVIPFFYLAESTKPFPQLIVDPQAVELGSVSQASRTQIRLVLGNPHNQPVLVERLQSSCPCLQGRDLPWLLEAGAESNVELTLDLVRESGFVGRLAIDLCGQTAEQDLAFRASVQLSVFAAQAGVSR
jgi:hypothetical protein